MTPQWPRRTGTAAVLVTVIALFACSRHKTESGPPARPLGQLIGLAGTVTLHRPNEAPRRPEPGPLFAGDVVETGGDGQAQVRLPDGRELTIGANSRFGLSGPVKKTPPSGGAPVSEIQIDLARGSVTSRLAGGVTGAGGEAISLAILTPFGITRVPSGESDATVVVGSQNVKVNVQMGEISFEPSNGAPAVVARAGDRIDGSFGQIDLVHAGEAPRTENAKGKDGGKAAASPIVLDIAPIEFVLAATGNAILVQRPGEKGFSSLGKEGSAPAGTAFRVPVGSRGQLVAKGLSAWLSPGSEGAVGRSTEDSARETYELQLNRGTALLTLGAGKAKEVHLTGGGGKVSVGTRDRASVSVTQGADGAVVEVLAGEADIAGGGNTQHVTAGSAVRLQAGHLKAVAVARPALVLPTTRGLQVYGDAINDVGLSWPPDIKQPTVEVARDAAFTRLILAGRTTGTQVNVVAPPSGDLYWRVIDGAGNRTAVAGQARFAPEHKRSKIANPRSLITETGLKATVYFQGVLPALTFTFTPQKSAQRYRLRVYSMDNAQKLIVEKTVTETSCPLPPGVLGEGSYQWNVAALDAQGGVIATGLTSHLDLVFDNALTGLGIARPLPGEPVTGDTVEVKGAVPLDSSLFLGGQPVALDAKGRFTLRAPSTSTLVFRLADRNGAQSYWVRALHKVPRGKAPP